MAKKIPVVLRDRRVFLTVDYRENTSAEESGFDALALPFPAESCIGYPTVHAALTELPLSGYRRYCGFIQLVERLEFLDGGEEPRRVLSLDVSAEMLQMGNPYFAYGYPAELYDAPCSNLDGCDKLLWRAYTYLVDMPSRMNHNQLLFLGGFSWGYVEDASGPLSLLDLDLLSADDWAEHLAFIKSQCPNLASLSTS